MTLSDLLLSSLGYQRMIAMDALGNLLVLYLLVVSTECRPDEFHFEIIPGR